MLNLVLILVLLWVALSAILLSGSRILQSALYSEPARDLYWRGPAAAMLLTLFYALWCYIDIRAPGQYTSLHLFTPTDAREFKELSAIVRKDGREKQIEYRLRRNDRGQIEYRETLPPYRTLPSHPEAIIVREDDALVRFDPERTGDRLKIPEGQSLHYLDSRGRVMSEDMIGRLSIFRWDRFAGNMLLNGFHFLLWFGCLWMLLRFQWTHALGLAVVLWLVMMVLVLQMLLDTAERMAV